MSKNWINILIIAGIFFGSIAVFFAIGKGVRALTPKPPVEQPGENNGSNGSIKIHEPDQPTPKKVDPPVLEPFEPKFNTQSRKYKLVPKLKQSEVAYNNILFELYTNSETEGLPAFTSSATDPNSILNVKQSKTPYYLVARDTLLNVESKPLEVYCKTRIVDANKLTSAINSQSLAQFKVSEYYYAIDKDCEVIKDGTRCPERGTNAIFTMIQNIKDGAWSGVEVTSLNPGNENNDFKVTKISITTF